MANNYGIKLFADVQISFTEMHRMENLCIYEMSTNFTFIPLYTNALF
jgi:hypothetical protein